jgi:hypothetical protein
MPIIKEKKTVIILAKAVSKCSLQVKIYIYNWLYLYLYTANFFIKLKGYNLCKMWKFSTWFHSS